MLKKFPSDKINVTRRKFFFLLRAPTHHSITSNSRFLYDLKHKVHLSKRLCDFFYFRFRLIFVKVYIFVQQKAWTLWKSITPRIMIFKLQGKIWKFNDIWVRAPQKTYLETNFLNLENWSFEYLTFWIVAFK